MQVRRLAMILTLAATPALAAIQLTGKWHVEDIGGMGALDASNVTLDFREPGRLAGSGGCNRYMATVSDEGIEIGPVASTMMACPEALMNREQRFFDALGTVTRHDRDETGALLLFTADGSHPVIVARQRRPQPCTGRNPCFPDGQRIRESDVFTMPCSLVHA